MKYFLIMLGFLFSTSSYSGLSADHIYVEGSENSVGVILLHGRGQDPNFKVVKPLRKKLPDETHRLGLQMPVTSGGMKSYLRELDRANRIIDDAITFLRDEKGVDRIVLIGHSMGGRMAANYVSSSNDDRVSDLVILGCRNQGPSRLSCINVLKGVDIPTLDIYGDDHKDSISASKRKAKSTRDNHTFSHIPGANHKFRGKMGEVREVIEDWLNLK